MYFKLTNAERLKDLRVERHLTLEQLADETGISKSALGSYETNEDIELSPFSVTTLAKFYGVSTDYLLGLTEAKNHPNTELHELGLSDGMIDLLKSGRINNRLLCEMATHEGFRRFMACSQFFARAVVMSFFAILGGGRAALRPPGVWEPPKPVPPAGHSVADRA